MEIFWSLLGGARIPSWVFSKGRAWTDLHHLWWGHVLIDAHQV